MKLKISHTKFNDLNKTMEQSIKQRIIESKNKLLETNNKNINMTGWIDYPNNISKDVIEDIINISKQIKQKCEILVVIGIGGSYLGTKAIFEALNSQRREYGELKVIFAGFSLSSTYTSYLLKYLENKAFCINYVTKGGNTTEPAIAFRLFKNLLKKQHKSFYKDWIYVTTGNKEGGAYKEAIKNDYKTFLIPENIGGRYSCFTPVTLLPLACKDVNIKEFIKGGIDARKQCINNEFGENIAMQYAYARYVYKEVYKKQIEALCVFSPRLFSLTSWWEQLFAESEGKQGKGLFPVGLSYSTDLHSIGQFVQDGSKIIAETIIDVKYALMGLEFPKDTDDFDNLNYLEGKDIHYINNRMLDATVKSHSQANIPITKIKIDKIDTYNLGYLMYIFMFACSISAYSIGVDPFNQPAVNIYKDNMYELLKKNKK